MIKNERYSGGNTANTSVDFNREGANSVIEELRLSFKDPIMQNIRTHRR